MIRYKEPLSKHSQFIASLAATMLIAAVPAHTAGLPLARVAGITGTAPDAAGLKRDPNAPTDVKLAIHAEKI